MSPVLAITQAAAVTDAITREMDQHPKISGWLSEARNQLIASGDEYTRDLGVKAVQLARLRGATAVDINDVQLAVKSLSNDADAWATWILTLAALLGGAAISGLVTLLAAATPPKAVEYWYGGVVLLSIVTLTLLYVARPKKR